MPSLRLHRERRDRLLFRPSRKPALARKMLGRRASRTNPRSNRGGSTVSDEGMNTPQMGSNSNGQLKSVLERINTLEDQKKDISEDIKDVYAEAKGNGYDVPALRAVVKRQRADA